MVTQKLISFKVDQSQLDLMDSLLPKIGYNRNKFLNKVLSTVLYCVNEQILYVERTKKDSRFIPFVSNDY